MGAVEQSSTVGLPSGLQMRLQFHKEVGESNSLTRYQDVTPNFICKAEDDWKGWCTPEQSWRSLFWEAVSLLPVLSVFPEPSQWDQPDCIVCSLWEGDVCVLWEELSYCPKQGIKEAETNQMWLKCLEKNQLKKREESIKLEQWSKVY